MTEPGQTGLSGRPAPGPVVVGYSTGSGTVMTRSHATEDRTVGRTSVRAKIVTKTLVSISYFIRTYHLMVKTSNTTIIRYDDN